MTANEPASTDVVISVLAVPEGQTPPDWWNDLSDEEQGRAEAFRFEADRNSYVAAHFLLRQRLGAMTGISARDLHFVQNEYGKPMLEADGEAVAFSLSHTRGMVAVALSRQASVGVDVEAVSRRISDEAAIVRAYFTPDEAAAFERAPAGSARRDLFMRFWTRKEAVLKAAGRGLGLPLSSFSVAGDDDRTAIPEIGEEAPFGFAIASRRFGAFDIAASARLAGPVRPAFVWPDGGPENIAR